MTVTEPVTELPRSDRIALRVLAGIAVALAAATLMIGGYQLMATLSGGETPVELWTRAEVPHTNEGQPQLVSAGFTNASVIASGLTDGTRALLATGLGLGPLTGVVVSGAIAFLFVSVSRGRPFARALYRVTLLTGATLAFGALLAQFVGGLGQMSAAEELNPTANDVFEVAFTFDPILPIAGFAVLALAYVFRAGARLQRETEGLV